MQHHLIEINKLIKSPQNARRTVAKGAAEDLKASILAHGILHNLVVTASDDDTYRVTDGGRRLEALKALQAEGRLPADYAVPCQLRSEEAALESSLAANTVRLAMHPADEFEAFAKLAEAGHAAGQIATRFGKTARYVEQRLKLGNADPSLLAAYRAEELTLESLMAFALTDDRERQMAIYQSLKGSHRLNPRDPRLPHRVDGRRRQHAGPLRRAGRLPRGGRHDAERSVQRRGVPRKPRTAARAGRGKRLEAVRRELEAEGWGWIEISPERDWRVISGCGRIHRQITDVPAELEAEQLRIGDELERPRRPDRRRRGQRGRIRPVGPARSRRTASPRHPGADRRPGRLRSRCRSASPGATCRSITTAG